MKYSIVRCGATVLNLHQVRANPVQYTQILQATKQSIGHGLCNCKLRIQIRRAGSTFHFAVWPDEGTLHDLRCEFHRDWGTLQTMENWAVQNAVNFEDDGHIIIRPQFLVERRTELARRIAELVPSNTKASNKRYASLPTLLQLLWMQSGNNRWFGQMRPRSKAMYHVKQVVQSCMLGKKPLAQMTYIPSVTSEMTMAAFWKYLQPAKTKVPSGLVIGLIKSFVQTPFGFKALLHDMTYPIFMTAEQQAQMATSYPRAFFPQKHNECAVALIHVELSSNGEYLRMLDGALLITSQDFLPVDSSYEAQLCNALVDEGRKFTKPMQVVDELLPDFILNDAQQEVFMEVWGMVTPEYKARKQRKQDLYVEQGKQLWEWDAVSSPLPPQLPTKCDA